MHSFGSFSWRWWSEFVWRRGKCAKLISGTAKSKFSNIPEIIGEDAWCGGACVQHDQGYKPTLGGEVSAERAAGVDQPRGHHLHHQVDLIGANVVCLNNMLKLNTWDKDILTLQDLHQAGQTAPHALLWPAWDWYYTCCHVSTFLCYSGSSPCLTLIMLIAREDKHHFGMCQGDLLSTAVQFHGRTLLMLIQIPAAPTRFWSWMLAMTGGLELWGVRSSTSPPPGPSSTSELLC